MVDYVSFNSDLTPLYLVRLRSGGSDQLFNMLVSGVAERKGYFTASSDDLTLLVGLDSTRKMSKSYDNYIAFNDSRRYLWKDYVDMDDVMWDYYRLLLLMGKEELDMSKYSPMDEETLAQN